MRMTLLIGIIAVVSGMSYFFYRHDKKIKEAQRWRVMYGSHVGPFRKED